MNSEAFWKLNPDVLRIVRLKVFGEDEVTEVQINYVLKTNNVDRETFDEAVAFVENQCRSVSVFGRFVFMVFVFTLVFWLIDTLF